MLKEQIKQIIDKNENIKDTLADLQANKPKLKDLFSSEKMHAFIQKLAIIILAIEKKYLAESGQTREDLIDAVVEYLDEKFDFRKILGFIIGSVVETIDDDIFKFIIVAVVNVIDKQAETQEQVAALMADMDSMTA